MKKCIGLILFSAIILMCLSSWAWQQEISSSTDITILAKEFVELLAKEDFPSAVEKFDAIVKAALPSDKLQEVWKSIIGQVGPFKRQVSTRIEKAGQLNIVFVTVEFEKSSLDIKIGFNNSKEIASLFFVPTQSLIEYKLPVYVKQNSFKEEELIVGSGEWAVHGTLTMPTGKGPFPAIILVHGSGGQLDRDESIFKNKPFRDMAWGLASQGIAVLRYEKRTKEHAQKFASIMDTITVKEETIDDALYAVSILRKEEQIDSKRIFVLGHSLGGMLIPRIGLLDPDIAGFIVMAGTTRPFEDVILDQLFYIFSLDGVISEEENTQIENIKQQVAKVKEMKLSDAPSGKLVLGLPVKYWLDLRGYNPARTAKQLKQPMLILQGERDYQVTMEDFQGWKNSLSSRKNVQFKSYPKLNHLFIEGEGKITPNEYLTAGHVAEIVIDDIANWIKRLN